MLIFIRIQLVYFCFAALLVFGVATIAVGGNHNAPSQQKAARPTEAMIENASRIHAPSNSYRFPSTVVYHYKADWRLLSAGVASLRVDLDSSSRQHISATADSTGFVARLYRVHDFFESFFDTKTFCSERVLKHTEEGSRRRDVKITFDYDRRKSVFEEMNLQSGQKKHLEGDIPDCATDVLSGVFYASSLPLEPGATYAFPVNDGGKTIDLEVHVEGREQIKTDAGIFNTLRVQPVASANLMRNKGKIWIWYSDDAERIPVQMRGRMGWGTLTLRLERIERGATAQAAK